MVEKRSCQAWTISDEFWEAIKGEIPKKERDPAKKYKNAPGQGRKPLQREKRWSGYFMCFGPAASGRHSPENMEAAALCIEGFRSGWQPVSLRKFGARVWNSTMRWKGLAGNGKAWTAVWSKRLLHWSPLERIQRTEEKKGTKRSVLVDEKGLPLAIVISGANTYDIKLLEEILDHIVVLRPELDEEHPQNVC